MGLFDKLGFGSKEEKPPRSLNHPRDLQMGDMIEFSLMQQSDLSNRSFEVTDIWTLNYGSATHKETYFKLLDVDYSIRLKAINDQTFEIALEVFPDTVLSIFNEDDIATILDPDTGVHHHLKTQTELANLDEHLKGWVAPSYRQEGFEISYRYNGDYRDKALPQHTDAGEIGCDYAWLVSDDRQHSLEFRVFDGGRTEAHLCAIIPMRKIESMWPAKNT